jgi:hypothetical protein
MVLNGTVCNCMQYNTCFDVWQAFEYYCRIKVKRHYKSVLKRKL